MSRLAQYAPARLPRLLVAVSLGLLGFGLGPRPALAQDPLDERAAGTGEWGFRPGDGEVSRRNPPSFSWRPQGKDGRYDLEIARDERFEEIEYRAEALRWNVHCPSRTFAPGEYHWRFRVAARATGDAPRPASAWSRTRSFRVAEDAAELAIPPLAELLPRVPTEHPRLFVRPEQRDELLARTTTTGREAYERLVARCERLLAEPPSTQEPPPYPADVVVKSEEWRTIWWGNRVRTIEVLESASALAFVAWLERREDCGALARRILLDAAHWDPKGSTGYRTNDEAGMPFAYHFCRTYTFLHDFLSEEERELCRKVMRVRGREMDAQLAPSHLWRPYSSHSNRAWHFLGEVGITFLGEIPEAADWLDFAVQVFANVYPVWSDDDGGWHEGMAYWRSYLERFTWWADVQREALGIDAFRLPFFAAAGDYALYLQPPGTQGGGFGDQNASRTSAQAAGLVDVLATQAHNPVWRWYAEQHDPAPPGEGFVDFLRSARPSVPAAPPDGLPTGKWFRGTGLAVLDTDLRSAADNVEVIFKCSPFGTQSHGYESQNAFLLYAYGERLLIRSGRRDVYGSDHHAHWMWETKSQNAITVGGVGQGVHTGNARGSILDFHTEPGFHFVLGEAAAAYGGRVSTAQRRIVLLEPDFVLVQDDVRPVEANTVEWCLHAQTPFLEDGAQRFVVHQGAAGCTVQFLEPTSLRCSQTDRFDPPPRERIQLVEHHLTAQHPATERARFTTLIRPFRGELAPPEVGGVERGDEGSLGFTAPLGEDRVVCRIREDGSLVLQRLDAVGELSFERELPALGGSGNG